MFGPGEAGCFRQVAALYSDHYRQVPLYIKCLGLVRLAALDRPAALYSDHYRQIPLYIKCLGLVRLAAFDWSAALYSDHYRQVPLYIKCLDQGRMAVLDGWLHYTVTTIDKFHCTSNVWTKDGWLL